MSIILNIAEGSAKKPDREFTRSLEISLGSVNEVVACLDVMKDLKKINNAEYKRLILYSETLAKQLGGFIKNIKNNC